jgi:RNA polymerase sigma factor (sigma-70 family)
MQQQAFTYEWVKAAKAGEEAPWRMLYRQLYPGVYAFALRICGEPCVAKDAVQEAFITAYCKLHQLKDPLAMEGWIKKMASRYCYKALHRNHQHRLVTTIPIETDGWWEDTISRYFEQLSTQGRLHTALAQLSESLRSTILLRYFSGYPSYHQIAAILGIPVGSVRSRLNQARMKLAEHWQQQPDAGNKRFTESEEWNSFYHMLYTGMHANDVCKNRFIDHLDKNIRIIHASGQTFTGSQLMEMMVAEDRQAGSSLAPVNIISSGNISIVEVKHFNSSEFPGHCPASSVTVLYRGKGKVSQMNLHPFLQ